MKFKKSRSLKKTNKNNKCVQKNIRSTECSAGHIRMCAHNFHWARVENREKKREPKIKAKPNHIVIVLLKQNSEINGQRINRRHSVQDATNTKKQKNKKSKQNDDKQANE